MPVLSAVGGLTVTIDMSTDEPIGDILGQLAVFADVMTTKRSSRGVEASIPIEGTWGKICLDADHIEKALQMTLPLDAIGDRDGH